ncbi:MAG: alpha/beta hydrolase [Spirosomataceae bacterium]
MATHPIQKPAWWLYCTEAIRACIELIGCLFFLWRYRFQRVGHQAPIVIIPGLTTSDSYTALLRWFIRKHGFEHVYPWGLGRNWGKMQYVSQLTEKMEALFEQHQQKITLIGWSLGGVFAREIAKNKPDLIEQVITLGSPFADTDAPNHARWVYELLNDVKAIDSTLLAQIPEPAPVRTTAFYSKQDGVVPWEVCKEHQEDELHTNIEVRGSHFGFPFNVQIYKFLIEGHLLAPTVCTDTPVVEVGLTT